MVPALLRNWFGASEILVSLMLVYVAQKVAAWMAFGPMKNPEGFNFPGSRNLQQYPAASNPELIAGTGLHWGGIAAILALALTWFVMSRHILGFHIRTAGAAPRAARFVGVRPQRLVALLAGFGAAVAVAVSGVEKGVRWMANINMLLAIALVLFMLCAGPTQYLLSTLMQNLGD